MTAAHHLTLWPETKADGRPPASYAYRPPRARCACGLFSFIGPHDLAVQLWTTHLKENAPDA